MLPDAKDFAEFIARETKPGAKIIEAGIGKERTVFNILRSHGFDVLAFDLNAGEESRGSTAKIAKLSAKEALEKGLFSKAEAIYAIRPNEELLSELIKIAEKLKIKLIVRPLKDDEKPKSMKLKNYKKSIIWVFEA